MKTFNFKKAAMFGKLSQLDRFNLKKAAMFGLDARIALAVFGALSLISGASLYSALQSAKATSFHQLFNEIAKAAEQYYLDNRYPVPRSGDTFYASDLIVNRESLATWNGPYFKNITRKSDASFVIEGIDFDYTYVTFRKGKNATWTLNSLSNSCTSGDCFLYLLMHLDNAQEHSDGKKLYTLLDEYLDESDGPIDGKIRYVERNSTDHYLMYQMMVYYD